MELQHVDARPTDIASGRPRGRILAVALVAAALVVAGCSSRGADETDRATVRVVGIDGVEGSEDVPDDEGGEDTVEATDGPDPDAPCGAISAFLFQPVEVYDSRSDPDDGSYEETDAELEEAMASLAEIRDHAPAELHEDIDTMIDVLRLMATGEDPDLDLGLDVDGLWASLTRWGAERCPPATPVWACGAVSTFVPIGTAIGTGHDEDYPSGFDRSPTPEGALSVEEEAGDRVVLLETADAVVFGVLDDDGFVRSTDQVDREGDGWVSGPSSSCLDDDDGASFQPIGEGD